MRDFARHLAILLQVHPVNNWQCKRCKKLNDYTWAWCRWCGPRTK